MDVLFFLKKLAGLKKKLYLCKTKLESMINKVAGVTLLLFGWVFATFWIFNHVDAWAGIGFGVVGLIIAANQINKKLNK
jgi:hypothetical protein